MENDREKAKEINSYTVKYGDKTVKVTQEISKTQKDNGETDIYLHRIWEVKDN